MYGTPSASSPRAKARMQRQGRKDTVPELRVRSALHAMGLRYRLQVPVPGLDRRTIDVCFPGARVAVFIDGCFWHGCPQHWTRPTSNAAWWDAKMARNRQRDVETSFHLRSRGWTVMRFWAHESVDRVAAQIVTAVRSGGRAEGEVTLSLHDRCGQVP
jgi:DNA mismatch endonuclease (patch repair protein)